MPDMNRREALAALATLPGVTSIQRARLMPTDVIVIERSPACREWTPEQVASFREQWLRQWPEQLVMVLPPGCSLKVYSREQAAQASVESNT